MVESNDEDPSARKAGDINGATSLFKECLGVEPKATNAVRIERKAAKSQLLKLTLDGKVCVLRNKSKSRKKGNSDYIKSIFITAGFPLIEQQRIKGSENILKEITKMVTVINHYTLNRHPVSHYSPELLYR